MTARPTKPSRARATARRGGAHPLDAGLLVFDGDRLLHADAVVRRMLDAEQHPDFEALVREAGLGEDGLIVGRIRLGHRDLRFDVHRIPERGLRVVLVQDERTERAVETDFRLASQMRAMATLYRAAAHDLKAPINSILLNIQLLEERLGTEAPRVARYLDVLREELRRLHRATEMILSQAAPAPRDPESVDLCDVFRELEALLAPQARAQRVTLGVHLPQGPVLCLGHRDQLKQALVNLAINALEAVSEGGTITLDLRKNGKYATLRVEDDGPGVPEDLRRRIFELNFSTKTEGKGIGLYVARSVVESHGGTIEVESNEGKGSRFRLELPLASD